MRFTRRELFELAGLAVLGRTATASGDEPLDATMHRAADVIRGYDAEGLHRTATAVDRASADRLLALARAAGAKPRLEPFEFSRVDPVAAYLEVDGRRIDGLPMFDGSFTTADGVTGPLGGVDSDRPVAWFAVTPQARGVGADTDVRSIREASSRRALIAMTTGEHPGLCPINADSFTSPFGPPVLQVGSEHRETIERAATHDANVRVVAQATRARATAYNVVANIRGSDANLPPVCVMTPRSGWYYNASERGGGLVCWLETLRACARTRHRRTVRFVASSGHELGHMGLRAYLTRNRGLASAAFVWVHYGANIGASTGDTRLTASDDQLEAIALRALGGVGLGGLPRMRPAQVGGEASTIAREGGRFVSFIGASAWFHNPGDRWPDAVDVERVARFARAAGDLTVALANAST